MGVGCGYVAPSAGLVRSQRLAVIGCGSGLTRVGAPSGLGGFESCGLGFSTVGCSAPSWRVRLCPSASGLLGVFSAGLGTAPRGAGGLGIGVRWSRRWLGGQARRAVWRAGPLGCCGCRRCRCADACGWQGGVCVRGWAWGDVPQASAFSSCVLEGLPQAPQDIRVFLGHAEDAGLHSQGLERIRQHGFPCGLWHPPPRRLEAAVLRQPLAGPVDQALEKGLCPDPLSQLRELRVGPAPPPLSLGGTVALGGGVGVGGCFWGRWDLWRWRAWGIPRSPVPWGCVESGGAGRRGLPGTHARSLPRGWVATRGGGGSGAFAVCGLTSRVGRGAGTLLVDPGAVLVRSGVVREPGVRAFRGDGTKRFALRPQRALP